LLSSGFARLPHYFTPFQAFVVSRTEQEGLRFNVETALLVLEREAQYRAGEPTPAGLFVYQFEAVSRNRLGYGGGLDRKQWLLDLEAELLEGGHDLAGPALALRPVAGQPIEKLAIGGIEQIAEDVQIGRLAVDGGGQCRRARVLRRAADAA